MEPKLSVIIAVLDSHSIVKNQLIHFLNMGFDGDVEFIIVDDGSDPAIQMPAEFGYSWVDEDIAMRSKSGAKFIIIRTNDNRDWSQPCARNSGAWIAKGSKLLMTDIDHILTKEAIEFCLKFDNDKVMFPRCWGILENGKIVQQPEKLFEYGLDKKLYKVRGLSGGMHHNTFMMKKDIYYMLNGYDESFCGKYGGDDTDFSSRYGMLARQGKAKRHVMGPSIYVYPDPSKDIKEVFHSLRRKG